MILHIEVHTSPFNRPGGIVSGSSESKNLAFMQEKTIIPIQAFWEWNY